MLDLYMEGSFLEETDEFVIDLLFGTVSFLTCVSCSGQGLIIH